MSSCRDMAEETGGEALILHQPTRELDWPSITKKERLLNYGIYHLNINKQTVDINIVSYIWRPIRAHLLWQQGRIPHILRKL